MQRTEEKKPPPMEVVDFEQPEDRNLSNLASTLSNIGQQYPRSLSLENKPLIQQDRLDDRLLDKKLLEEIQTLGKEIKREEQKRRLSQSILQSIFSNNREERRDWHLPNLSPRLFTFFEEDRQFFNEIRSISRGKEKVQKSQELKEFQEPTQFRLTRSRPGVE